MVTENEESKTTAVGRKRKQPTLPDPDAAAAARVVHERQKRRRTVSDFGDPSDSSRRESRESGEISTSASSRRVSDTSGQDAGESSGPKYSRRSLGNIKDQNLKKYIGTLHKQEPARTIPALVYHVAKFGPDFSSKARKQLEVWISSSGGPTTIAAADSPRGLGNVRRFFPVKQFGNITMQDLADEPGLTKAVERLRGEHSPPLTVWEAMTQLFTRESHKKVIRRCFTLFQLVAFQPQQVQIPGSSKTLATSSQPASVEEGKPETIEISSDDDEGADDHVSLHDYNDESSESDGDGDDSSVVSVGEAPVSNDYGSLARSAATATAQPITRAPVLEPHFRLAEISDAEQALQYRYFGVSDPEAFVQCLTCGVEGHMEDGCPEKVCKHCGIQGEHFSAACSTYRKCGLCRKRGHDARRCRNRSGDEGAGELCDICEQTDHIEEECPGLWQTYKPDPSRVVRIPARQMVVGCYNCGSMHDHWGDDCPRLPPFLRRRNGTWSAKWADQFIEGGDGNVAVVGNEGRGYDHSYQLGLLGDMRD